MRANWRATMSSANFPTNDLRRRKLQTSLSVATLTLSVASTLFLLLFTSRLGIGFAALSGTLTLGLSAIFSQFLLFIGVLIFAVGAVLTSFIVYLLMAQRTRAFGLIKAAGCPNNLVAGYFMTELLTITFVGCILGVAFGFLADFLAANIVFSAYTIPSFISLLFAPLVFFVFFILALVFGLQPILKASRMPPINALSPVTYYSLTAAGNHQALSHSALTWRIATRSLFRRQSTGIRIVILLSIMFILLTVSVAGGIIASETTTSWIQTPTGNDAIAIAHSSMGNRYQQLLSNFTGPVITTAFNYSDPNLGIPETVIEQLNSLPSVGLVDSRLVIYGHVQEVSNFTVNPDNSETFPVGGNREGDALIVGVTPSQLVGSWSIQGRFIGDNASLEAVIGDSISHTMYAANPSKRVALSNPLVQCIRYQNNSFPIVGICIDPLNNGYVTYVPLKTLENITSLSSPNLLLLKLNPSIDRNTAINQIKSTIQAQNSDLDVFDLNAVVNKDTSFLASTWQTVMLLPLFTLLSAALSLVGYMMLSVDEQRQEFAVLRAVGAKPRIIPAVSAIQSAIVLVSSFGVGITFGIIITLMILMTNPLVTAVTILEIAGWLLAALFGMFLLSIYPAYRIAKSAILKIMA
jgi:ABC-type antimicrobial peptide transport system permease subunit